MKENNMPVYVLLRASKKTGKVDTEMTGITPALVKMWALNNTTKSKTTVILERDTGKIVSIYTGRAGDMPEIDEPKNAYCHEIGIPLEVLRKIKDDRFDK